MSLPDVLVVGAGISGAAAACFMARRGMRVRLVDRFHPAWGASGRNPGFLWFQHKPAAHIAYYTAARSFAGALAEEMPDYGFRASGGVLTWRDDAVAPLATAHVADRQAAGIPCELLDRAALREVCPALGPRVSGACWCPLDAWQDTARLVAHMVAEVEARGGSVTAGADVTALLVSGDRCRGVRLSDGADLLAGTVMLATGPWTNHLLAPLGLSLPLRPVRFEAAETAGPAGFALGPVHCGQGLFHITMPEAFPDDCLHPAQRIDPAIRLTEQVAQRPDGRLVYGCAYRLDTTDDRPTVAGQGMAQAILPLNLPGMAGLAPGRAWAGIVAETPDQLPVIDRIGPEGLVLNALNCNGNLTGAYAGHLAAGLVAGTPDPDLPRLSAARFDSPAP